MRNGYFKRVYDLTGTKLWINNVTRDEARKAIEFGAFGCTQNPSYTWKMLNHKTESEYAGALLRESMKESDDPSEVECILQRRLVKGISDVFMPLFEKSHGKFGYVSIQGDPVNEEDPEVILNEARKNRELNPNIMIKIPVTSAGLIAMETLIAENTPINATEVMGLSQALTLCKMYRRLTEKTGNSPVIYYSLITGIFDEYLSKYVESNKIDISSDILYLAGLIIAQKTYQITRTHYPEIGYIGGGVRGLHHFTEMVGADVCITMNMEGQAEELLKLNQPAVPRFFNPVPERFLDELLSKVPDFHRAYFEEGMKIEEFEHFGPVEYFREMFVGSWSSVINHIIEIKKTE